MTPLCFPLHPFLNRPHCSCPHPLSPFPLLSQCLLPARWATQDAGYSTDDGHAIRLIPLGTFNLIDLKLGGKLAGKSTELQLRMSALHAENHQLKIQDLRSGCVRVKGAFV